MEDFQKFSQKFQYGMLSGLDNESKESFGLDGSNQVLDSFLLCWGWSSEAKLGMLIF